MYSMIILTWKPIVIHINLFNHTFLFFIFWKGPYWLAHYKTFWDIGHSPLEAPLWTGSCKIETNVFLPMGHLFTLYTRELTFGQSMWNQNEVLHATFWGTTWEQWGTSWEHIENMMETREKRKIFLLLILSRKEKNWTCHESMLSLSLAAWNFCFENSLSPYLAWANGMEQPQ